MEKMARFGCFMFWSGLGAAIGLTYSFLNGGVPLYRLLDIISISFFFALFLTTLDALFDARNKPMAGVFLFIFVAIAFVPSALGRQYPEISIGHAGWLLLAFCAIASLPIIIWLVAHRKVENEEIALDVLAWMIIADWSAVLGISFWISLFKGVWLSVSEIGLSFLAACVGAFVSLIFFGLISGFLVIVDKIASLHRRGFPKKAKECSKS